MCHMPFHFKEVVHVPNLYIEKKNVADAFSRIQSTPHESKLEHKHSRCFASIEYQINRI